jgi:hypothetical protein
LGSLVLLGGAGYKVATRSSISWPQAVFKAAQLLINAPGGSAVDTDGDAAAGQPPSKYSRWVTHLLYVQGLVVFSFFLGLVATDVSGAFERVGSGRHAVLEQGHTVLVNWNENTVRGERGWGCVVVGERERERDWFHLGLGVARAEVSRNRRVCGGGFMP